MPERVFPTVSIIIPTYNSEALLETALKSIVRQTYPYREIVIIDGGSTDHTVDVIKQYSAHVAYWVSKKDAGIYDAMNKGVEAATGDWIYFMGSDDELYEADTLEKVFRQTILLDCQIVYGDVVSTRFTGRYDGEFTTEKLLKKNICHQAIFTHKELFHKIGTFDVRFRSQADWDFNLRWFLDSSVKRVYLDLPIATYADGGISSTHGDRLFKEERLEKILLYGQKTLPRKLLREVYASLFFQYLKKMNFSKMTAYLFRHTFQSKDRVFFWQSIAKVAIKKIA